MSRRRALLAAGTWTITAVAAPLRAATAATAAKAITVAQIFDTSDAQQDVSKDFLIGSRAAWQDTNAKGGLHGRPVNHVSLEVDGSPANLKRALDSVRDNPACVLLSGSAGDAVASQIARMMRQENMLMAHVAPWLQNSSLEVDDRTFPIFAARQEQITHALKTLTVVGVQDVGAVYATAQDHSLYRDDVERAAAALKLRLATFKGAQDLARLGQQLTPGTPAILLFIGGTPELVQFTQGLDKQQRQRYIVALADVNLQTLLQMGAGRGTPVIATQAVPLTTASLPVVRAYRDVMSRLFDEPPTALSLAGFIAARYTFEVLNDIEGPVTRPSALAAFQRRANVDVGGYRINYDPRRRSGNYVTQSMLTPDGRVIG